MDLQETSTKDLWKDIYNTGNLHYCFNCSTCVSGCPASHGDPPLLVRNLARMVILGLEEELLADDTPWACVSCSKCEEMCPMNVMPFEMILSIRQWQCRNDETLIPSSIVEIYQAGLYSGCRGEHGVTRVPGVAPLTHHNQKSGTTGIVPRNAHEDAE